MKNEAARLHIANCNKAKCKTCIFGPTPVKLTPWRIIEIHTYLSCFEASHVCHTTNKTCFGALEFQAKILHSMNVISEPTVMSMLITAKTVLNIKK